MKLNKLILLAVILLAISTILVIITFSLVFWLNVNSNSNNYGMWQGCFTNVSVCARWYDNGQALFGFFMNDAFKAFQGLQIIFLVTLFFSSVTLLMNMQFFPESFWFYVFNSSLIFISNICALASLLIFVINVYDYQVYTLGWCYWVSVAVVAVDFFVMLIVCIHSVRLKRVPKEISKQSLIKEFNDTKTNQEQSIATAKQSEIDRYPKSRESKSRKPESHGNAKNRLKPTFDRNEQSMNLKRDKYYLKEKRYSHKHIHKASREQFQAGYSSEPEFIQYSLDRSWLTHNNQKNNSTNDVSNQKLPADFESKIESEMLDVELPKLVYYDGADHYQRSDFKKVNKA